MPGAALHRDVPWIRITSTFPELLLSPNKAAQAGDVAGQLLVVFVLRGILDRTDINRLT